MASSDAQPSHSFSIDGYLVELQLLDDQTINITVRDDIQMITYGAEAYHLNRINAKTVLAALGRQRKEVTSGITSIKADSQEAVEITVAVEVPLLPKVVEKICLPLTKRLESGEALRSKLNDVKREIIKNQAKLEQFKLNNKRRVYKYEKSLACSKEEKHTMTTLQLQKGEYLVTVSGFLKSNASNYAHLTMSSGPDICPGQLYALPADWNQTGSPILIRTKIMVEDDYQLQLFGQYGSSYPYTLENFLFTAEFISQGE